MKKKDKSSVKSVDVSVLKSNALQSATYDTILQVCLRIVSFLLNSFIVRHVSSSVFAVITVRLYLLYATGLLLSREAFRRAALGCKSPKDVKKIVNLIWIGTGLSIPLSIIGWVIWAYVMEIPPLNVTEHYHSGIMFTIFSVVIEVCAESPYIMAELHMWVKVKVVIEGLMQLLRAILLALGIYIWPEKAVLVYGIAHVTGSILYCCSFYLVFAFELSRKKQTKKLLFGKFRSLFVTFTKGKILPEIDYELWFVSVSFIKQGWVKELLTDGELYIMNFMTLVSLAEQGVYQVVNNLGSLAARLIFRSIEAAAYKFFAQCIHRGVKIKDQDQSKMKEVNTFLSALLKNTILVSFFFVTFGWAYAHPMLHLYGGSHLSSSGYNILRFHSLYIFFMAVNGITESFSFATMSEGELARYNYTLICNSLVYIAVTILFSLYFGVYGFVIGNCVNMTLRILNSLYFIKLLFEGSKFRPLDSLHVSLKIFSSFLMAFIVTALSEIYIYPSSFIGHIAVGGICCCFVVVSLKKELKDILVPGFSIIDNLYSKIFSKSRKSRFNFFILNIIYNLLYNN